MSSGYIQQFLPKDVLLESFTFPFFDLNNRVDPRALVKLFHDIPDPTPGRGKKGLYVHIPFCETICNFCPFIKSVGSEERVAAFLRALHREIDLMATTPLCRSWTLDSVYVGGGTPSVLTPDQIAALLTKISSSFTVSPNVEFTIEVEPKSASEEFCAAAASTGANRISFGVQTLHPDFRAMMNLTASLEQIEALSRRSRSMFSAGNIDMIVGYPGQTDADIARDMAEAIDLGVGNVSVYPLDYLAVLPHFLDRMRKQKLSPPPSERRWEMFHHGRAELKRRYQAQNMYFFTEPGMAGCQYMFDIVYGGYYDEFIGLGTSAYSMMRGISYSNTQSEQQYISELLEKDTLPIEAATPGFAYEKHYVYFGKRTVANLTEAKELGIISAIQPKFDALEQAGHVERRDQTYTLTESGERLYAQIMVGFLSDNQRRLYDRVCERMKEALNWGLDGATSPKNAKIRGWGAKNSMARGDPPLRSINSGSTGSPPSA